MFLAQLAGLLGLVWLSLVVATDHSHYEDYYSEPHYMFEYSVHDPHTGDMKTQHEIREGDSVKGFYVVQEADGSTREVQYTADKDTGFNAVVTRSNDHHHHHTGA